jgi:hypothetical protein
MHHGTQRELQCQVSAVAATCVRSAQHRHHTDAMLSSLSLLAARVGVIQICDNSVPVIVSHVQTMSPNPSRGSLPSGGLPQLPFVLLCRDWQTLGETGIVGANSHTTVS